MANYSTPSYRPLLPETTDQGDPFLFAPPAGSDARFRYYVYATGDDADRDLVFPVYGSDDLVTWRRLGNALTRTHDGWHWAPSVTYVPGLARPFVMLFSRSIGPGELGHVGHAIRRADAISPE